MAAKKAALRVRDLRKHLARGGMTPENFAGKVPLSSMTIRRWLKKSDRELLPAKYLPFLGPALGIAPSPGMPKVSLARAMQSLSVDALMREIEKAGSSFKDLRGLEAAVLKRLKQASADRMFQACCLGLLKAAKAAKARSRTKAIAAGALLYFVEPTGAPDETPIVRYLGELAVLSMALNYIYSIG